ncbi:MAG: haloacetate dehalogenase [Pseudonocardiales bacterium]|jgi:haloacetate dehalogenase|nr:haloacetate dehalogenase [Pseudonocardiales bacterium]
MFPGFETFDLQVPTATSPVRIHGVRGGSGPPLLLLHGFPQSHVLWHRLAPLLAEEHTVVATDLRGYGDSDRRVSADGPDTPGSERHAESSFRAMAADQVAVMAELGFDEFAVVGHDRGARVTHRLALDHPDAVTRLALLDIMPTEYVYSHVDRRLATAYYHWFLFIQPFDLPERLLAGDPGAYLHSLLGGWGSGLDAHAPAAVAEYERVFADPDARHAMLEDYRAGASIDLAHDAESERAGRRIAAPCLVLWGGRGVVGNSRDHPLEVWRSRAADPSLVTGEPIAEAGHFFVDERPEETLAALAPFLKG